MTLVADQGFAELIKSADIMYFDWLESSGVRPLSPPQVGLVVSVDCTTTGSTPTAAPASSDL